MPMESTHAKKSIVELARLSSEEYRRLRKLPVRVMADSVRSMHNIGAIFRTADAFRMDSVVLCGISGRPPHPDLHKTALGAEDTVEWTYAPDALAEARRLRAEGWKLCVVEQTAGSIPLADYAPAADERYVIVMGNEVEGVAQAIADEADVVLEIPQEGTKHSLNVSVCAGIVMWHFYSHLVGEDK